MNVVDSATRASRWRSGVVAALLALAVVALNIVLWRVFNPPIIANSAPEEFTGMAYNAFQRWDSPISQRFPNSDEVEADLTALSAYTDRLRTYSSSEFPDLPRLALQKGFKLAAGVWLDTRAENNELEIKAVLAAVARHPNITRVIAGNETQLHSLLGPEELYAYLDRLRTRLSVPVSTAEPWHIWIAQPELAEHVDFITIHLLPYWEGVPVEAAVDEALRRYGEVRAAFPDKPVVIGEIGWPSGGFTIDGARATPDNQARFIREFLGRIQNQTFDYYVMEAVDQPWKAVTEGRVGAHWGYLNANRTPKFSMDGPLESDPYWRAKATASAVLALIPLLPFLYIFSGMTISGRFTFAVCVQAVATFAVLLGTQPLSDYLRWYDILLLGLLVPALMLMGAILLSQALEFAELFWRGSLHKVEKAAPVEGDTLPDGSPLPLVSIHLACCNEPPDMVLATVKSLLALDWPRLEIVVVDNNTKDPALWQPLQQFAHDLKDPRLHFHHLPEWPGYKAGALNYALEHTSAEAGWIGVVDADYVVDPQWLRQLAGHFAAPDVAVVQSPQAHREWEGQRLTRMMNWEYEGFFRLGMHHRHERNALVQHGTMTLIRAASMRAVNGWNTTCICEDTELGLRLLQRGERLLYVDEVLGTGLVPSNFAAYQRQRKRWAEGAMQILRQHARALVSPGHLTAAQRYHFVAGWLPWVGDALHLCFSFAAMAWTFGLLAMPKYFTVPIALFVVPLVVFFLARLLLVPLLYTRRVPCKFTDIVGAAVAGMGLSHSVARGVLAGLSGRLARFEITTKGKKTAKDKTASASTFELPVWMKSVREEAVLLAGLLVCVLALLAQDTLPMDNAMMGWMLVLAIQSVPYLAAVGVAALGRDPDTELPTPAAIPSTSPTA
jgi:exo-beta-1,3-glucanase (GH17 family)/cellulose synthase/poly-beta-1,6-N-acetylglucosamine synthase-like glycosyltransferase